MDSTVYREHVILNGYKAVLKLDTGELLIVVKVSDEHGVSYWSKKLNIPLKEVESLLISYNDATWVKVCNISHDYIYLGDQKITRLRVLLNKLTLRGRPFSGTEFSSYVIRLLMKEKYGVDIL